MEPAFGAKLFRLIEIARVTVSDIRADEDAGALRDEVAGEFNRFYRPPRKSERGRVEAHPFLENGGGVRQAG